MIEVEKVSKDGLDGAKSSVEEYRFEMFWR
jgi:hypothetical protein